MKILKHLRNVFVPHADNNYTPHALGHRPLSLYAGLMVSIKLVSLFSLALLPQNQAFSSAVTPANIYELTNSSRQAYNLPALKTNALLSAAAQKKAEDMVKSQYFSHNSPDGHTPWDFIKGAGYNYIIAGENLAINFYSSESLENAWMNSPGHKANILNHDFEDIGIGVVQGEYKGVKAIFVVQMFGTSSVQPIQAQVAYSTPVQLISLSEVNVPAPTKISLATPIIAGESFALTNQQSFPVHGYAPEADAVYVVVNNKPQIKLDVINGEYKGEISLAEGLNKIRVLSFNSANQASPISKELNVKLDSIAPIVSASIEQVSNPNDKSYLIDVQGQGDVTKVIATIGDQKLLLQPTADSNVWQAKVSANTAALQGGINVRAYDLAGNVKTNVVGTFSSSIQGSYGFLAQKDYQVSYLGKLIPLNLVNDVYIYFILFLLFALAVTIAIKRNVQNLSLIAHTSAMIVVAVILWST
ncbi:MAG: hypothetical protein JWO40_258 [Candidatus Doudnabacteria bacterium]|nr:hypothetical protein [Candidatus Doudnabacteria bacterium]